MNAVVLTSENSEAFYAEKLGLPPPEPAAAPAKPEGAKPGEPAIESGAQVKPEPETDEQPDSQHPDPEKRQKLNLRFSELSKARKAAEAEADKAKADAKAASEARELAEREARELRAKYEPPKPDALGPKPARAQFANDDEFALALEEWAGDKAIRERDQKEAQAKIERQWSERQTATKASLPDYDAVLSAGASLVVSNEVRDAILESEDGPGLLYHLASNPDFVRDLATKSSNAALRIVGRLEETKPWLKKAAAPLGASKETPKPAAAASEISRAPAPITPLKGGTSIPEVPIDANGVFHGTHAEWKRLRTEGKIK